MLLTLTIDGKSVTVEPEATILEAARLAGASIPTLCQDDRLHPYGACRVCLVEIEGPPRRLLPACTTLAAEGMSVLTRTPAVQEARKDILEMLLINHPLDCPVCDKAGECRLQDLVHECGLGPGIFTEEKRTFPPDYSSPVIERNQNRCILCGKCVRVCNERCGVGALTFGMRGGNSRITTAFDRPLNCEFCGECVESCPVGALTAKQSKHKSRSWNVEQTASTCIYCGCGCPLTIETRETGRSGVVRVRASGDHYLCAKGRFGWDAVVHEARLTTPKIRVKEELVDCTWEEVLLFAATGLNAVKNRNGADHIGGLGSTRTLNEDNYLFQKFMRTVAGTNNVDFLGRGAVPYGLNSAYFAEELSALGEHGVILMLDTRAGEINPLLGIEIVRAVNRGGSKLILVGGEENKFSRIASVVIPDEREKALARLIAGVRRSGRIVSLKIKQAVQLLASSQSAAFVMPAGLSSGSFPLIAELASLLGPVTHYPVFTRGNIQGALDMGVLPGYLPGYLPVGPEHASFFGNESGLPVTAGKNAHEMIAGIAKGEIASLYIMGDDPVGSDPAMADVLRRLEFLIVQDIFHTDTAKIAHVVLPAASFMERTGTFTSIERRLRRVNKAVGRLGESKPDWEIIMALAERMGVVMDCTSPAEIMKEIRAKVPLYRGVADGACWPGELSPLHGTGADLSLPSDPSSHRSVLTAGRRLFSSGMMTTRSKELASIAQPEIVRP